MLNVTRSYLHVKVLPTVHESCCQNHVHSGRVVNVMYCTFACEFPASQGKGRGAARAVCSLTASTPGGGYVYDPRT